MIKKNITLDRLLSTRVLFIDGAMGTLIDSAGLQSSDYKGFDGCPEILNSTRPDLIESIHIQYLNAGADIIETNTFGANGLTLKEYDLDAMTFDLNVAGASIARHAIQTADKADRTRFVAGSIGPGSRLPSIGHIDTEDIYNAYEPQIRGLLTGGVDLLIIETAQDLLHLKTLIRLIDDVSSTLGNDIPLIVSVTIESNGTMLAGSDVPAVVTALEPFPLTALGLNCATGPEGMRSHLRHLSQISPFPVFAMPNAGMPVHRQGHFVYELSSQSMAEQTGMFVRELGANIVGGCCGSTPEHIRTIVETVGICHPADKPFMKYEVSVSSLFQSQPVRVNPAPFIIGERGNATGSRAFKNALIDNDLESMISIINQQEREGAHAVDVSVSTVGRNETSDMKRLIRHLNTECRLPLQIDTTDTDVMEAALKLCAGRSIINSANLERGEEHFLRIAGLCKKYGAMLICLTIDEEGMAATADRKISIANRMITLAQNAGLRISDLLVDTLTFTLGSGDESGRNSAFETLKAIKVLKNHHPDINLLLGVSNVSFGLNPKVRYYLNSVMLYEAVQHGLDAAIIHSGKIYPLSQIPEKIRQLCRDLIYNVNENSDPLLTLITETESSTGMTDDKKEFDSPGDKLRNKLMLGEGTELEDILNDLRQTQEPLSIINHILLPAMKEIGDLFGTGKMQLPFVLKSASVMKKAVDLLKPHMDKSVSSVRGTVVLATVRGDVHDIGKNLVDIVLSNNGYVVHNIGIKQSPEAIFGAVQASRPNALGLSGLLVRSTIEMKNTLIFLRENGIRIPVLLGGAALSESFVREILAPEYGGSLFYAEDAFEGLNILDEIMSNVPINKTTANKSHENHEITSKANESTIENKMEHYTYPKPPFTGAFTRENISPAELKNFINLKTLLMFQWQFRKGKMSQEKYDNILKVEGEERFESMMSDPDILASLIPRVVYGYFTARRIDRDTVEVRDPKTTKMIKLDFPRQSSGACLSVSDYFLRDHENILPIQLVTMGEKAMEYSRFLYKSDDYAGYFFFHGLIMQLTEALAEENHAHILYELGLDKEKASGIRKPEMYQGIRISPGYAMAPGLDVQTDLLDILNARTIGVSVSSGFQLVPECSTTALILIHPEAKYFKI